MNRRTNVLVTYLGRTQTVCEWADEFGVNADTVYRRINSGWPTESLFLKAEKRKLKDRNRSMVTRRQRNRKNKPHNSNAKSTGRDPRNKIAVMLSNHFGRRVSPESIIIVNKSSHWWEVRITLETDDSFLLICRNSMSRFQKSSSLNGFEIRDCELGKEIYALSEQKK